MKLSPFSISLFVQVKLARFLRAESLIHFSRMFYTEFIGHLRDHLKHGATLCAPYINIMKQGKPFPLSMCDFEKLRTNDSAGAMCVHLAGKQRGRDSWDGLGIRISILN